MRQIKNTGKEDLLVYSICTSKVTEEDVIIEEEKVIEVQKDVEEKPRKKSKEEMKEQAFKVKFAIN